MKGVSSRTSIDRGKVTTCHLPSYSARDNPTQLQMRPRLNRCLEGKRIGAGKARFGWPQTAVYRSARRPASDAFGGSSMCNPGVTAGVIRSPRGLGESRRQGTKSDRLESIQTAPGRHGPLRPANSIRFDQPGCFSDAASAAPCGVASLRGWPRRRRPMPPPPRPASNPPPARDRACPCRNGA